jgi:hypothetical protein
MTHSSALDAAIRQARHLLFAFDGPIRSTDAGMPADSATPTAPYIHEALAACRDSGRSAVVITPKPLIDVPAYLNTHDLFTQVTVIAASISDAVSSLEALRPTAYSSPVHRPTSKPSKPQEHPASATPEPPTTLPTWSTPEQSHPSTAWLS